MASKLLSNEFQKHICLDYECTTIEEAIHKAGNLLVQTGCVKPPYINGMLRREQETSTDIGFGVMIPMAQKTLWILFLNQESVLFRSHMGFLTMEIPYIW